jgi:hypothetical protein
MGLHGLLTGILLLEVDAQERVRCLTMDIQGPHRKHLLLCFYIYSASHNNGSYTIVASVFFVSGMSRCPATGLYVIVLLNDWNVDLLANYLATAPGKLEVTVVCSSAYFYFAEDCTKCMGIFFVMFWDQCSHRLEGLASLLAKELVAPSSRNLVQSS